MEIYLVRHGQTDGNVAYRHQADTTTLSFAGKVQVERVAIKLQKLEPTHLVTSKLLRAVETAKVIGFTCNLIPETSEHFNELNQPDWLYGRHLQSLPSLLHYTRWYFGLDKESVKGESYADLRQRFLQAKAELASYPEEARVVVVSHSAFISLFVAHLCREKALWPHHAAIVLIKMLLMKNTEVIKIAFSKSKPNNRCSWTVKS